MTDPLHAPSSFRGGLLWSFWELAKFSLPIRPTKPTPNNMPEATSPKTSAPCSASTRGLPRSFRSFIAPSSASTKPVNRLLFFRSAHFSFTVPLNIHSPPARIPAPNHCDRKAGIVSPQPARPDYDTRSWERGEFMLPTFGGDFALLTPKDILTRDETWINRPGLINSFYHIAAAVPDSALRAQINDYFKRQLSRKPKEKEIRQAASRTIAQYPVLIEHYIKQQEDNGDDAIAVSKEEVGAIEQVFIAGAGPLIDRKS